MKQSIRRRTPVCPVPKPRRRNVSQTDEASPSARLTLTEVGVSRLPGQVLRRLLRQSYSLNVLVVGAAGLGKSSLIRTLLRTAIIELQVYFLTQSYKKFAKIPNI